MGAMMDVMFVFSVISYVYCHVQSFKQGDCWICMELMSVSLDKFYKFACETLQQLIPEAVLGKMTVAVSSPYITAQVSLSVNIVNMVKVGSVICRGRL